MKVLITGASGLLGKALVQRFESINPIACAFSRASDSQKKVDLSDVDQIKALLEETKPDIIIHAAAERRPEVCSQNMSHTRALNVVATRTLAEQAKKCGAWLLYISTDYVFDGESAPYHPYDQTNPLNAYGQSKLAGEIEIQKILSHYGILRVGILYGQTTNLEESAVTTLLSLLDQDHAVVDHYCRRYPTDIKDVANACWQLVQIANKSHNFKGVWHYTSYQALTKFDMLKAMAKRLGKAMDHIKPMCSPVYETPRPFDCALDCKDLFTLGIKPPKKFSKGIEFLNK